MDIAADCPPPPAGDPPKAFHVVTADGVDDTVRIDGFTITDGLADGVFIDGLGAGMLIDSASPALVRVRFTANAAPAHGGGAIPIDGDAHPLMVNCEFDANTGDEGGAIHTEFGDAGATLVNCLLTGNTATRHGGAIDYGGGPAEMLLLINCTIADNTAETEDGGAIYIHFNGQVTVVNSILWGNTSAGPPASDQIHISSGTANVTYSDVEGPIDPAWDGGNNITDDPLFVAAGTNYRLNNGSPCIDAADNDAVPCDEFDIDHNGLNCLSDPIQDTPDLDLGKRRIDDPDTIDTGNGFAPIVDMGTYEFCPPNSCPWDLDGGGFVGAGDLLLLLADWGNPYGAAELLALLADWGACPSQSFEPPSLAEELADACLSQADWDKFVAVMTDPNAPQVKKDRYLCWMEHYLFDCNKCICIGLSGCPNPDPFSS